MLLVIELGSDVMQNIVCNTKSIIFVTVITIPCKTIRKKKNDNKKKVMQKFLEFFTTSIVSNCTYHRMSQYVSFIWVVNLYKHIF